MVFQRARNRIRNNLPRTIVNVKQTSGTFMVLLTIMAIIFFYLITWVLSQFFNIGAFRIPVQESFYLFLLGFAVVFPWYVLDRPPHFTWGDFFRVSLAYCASFFFITIVAPRILPSVFSTPASILKMSVYSLVGLP